MKKEDLVSREQYKEIKKYNRKQLEHFLKDIYKSGYEDGRKSVSGIEIDKLIEVIGEVKGIGSKKLEDIRKKLDITFSILKK